MKKGKLILSFLLAFILALSPVTAFASDYDDGLDGGFRSGGGASRGNWYGINGDIATYFRLLELERDEENYKYWAFFAVNSSATADNTTNYYPYYFVEFNYYSDDVKTIVPYRHPTQGYTYKSWDLNYYVSNISEYQWCEVTSDKGTWSDKKTKSSYSLKSAYRSGAVLFSNANFYSSDGELMYERFSVGSSSDTEDSETGESGGGRSRDDVGNFYDENGNLINDETDYGIFTPIVNFFKSIINRLQKIYVFIKTVDIAIKNALEDFFSDPIENLKDFFTDFSTLKTSLTDWIKNFKEKISDAFTSVNESLFEKVKGLFVPDSDYIAEKVEFLRNKFAVTFGVTTYDMGDVLKTETSFTDFKIKIFGKECTIISMKFVIDALATFRPLIRGFIALLLVFYNINQFLGFIGQEGATLGGHISGLNEQSHHWDSYKSLRG